MKYLQFIILLIASTAATLDAQAYELYSRDGRRELTQKDLKAWRSILLYDDENPAAFINIDDYFTYKLNDDVMFEVINYDNGIFSDNGNSITLKGFLGTTLTFTFMSDEFSHEKYYTLRVERPNYRTLKTNTVEVKFNKVAFANKNSDIIGLETAYGTTPVLFDALRMIAKKFKGKD